MMNTHAIQDEHGVVWFFQPSDYYEVTIYYNGEINKGILCRMHKNAMVNALDGMPEINVGVEPIHDKLCVCETCHYHSLRKKKEEEKQND